MLHAKCITQKLSQCDAVYDALGICCVTLIVGECRFVEYLAQSTKLAIIPDREIEPTILCLESLIWCDIGVRISHSPGAIAGYEIVHTLIGKHSDHCVQQGDINMLTPSRTLAVCECRLNADDRI